MQRVLSPRVQLYVVGTNQAQRLHLFQYKYIKIKYDVRMYTHILLQNRQIIWKVNSDIQAYSFIC